MNMKKAGQLIGLLMGLTMSFCLSLIGMVSAGQFSVPGFLKSFVISFIISLLLGLLIPVRKISTSLVRKCGLKPGTLKARLMESLVTTLTYSPIMTLIMVWMAWKQATSHGARIPFGPMLLKSEIISLIGAFVISFLAAPLWTSLVMKRVNSSLE
ncbi:MAG: hypothetical protein II161_06400 [Erysipelotrichaceae bacterium]|nr:hypothetical protein [Erysipelotrichaceae bacterium]